MPAMLRYLRIAVTALSLTACVLVIALWGRSFSHLDILEQQAKLRAFQISSVKGRIATAQLKPRVSYVTSSPYSRFDAGDAAEWRYAGVFGFAYYDDSFVTALVAPHWFTATLFAGLAVIPWFSRNWRFSLRTLLIATTLVAVVLGLIVASM